MHFDSTLRHGDAKRQGATTHHCVNQQVAIEGRLLRVEMENYEERFPVMK
jgi:hypothetical protein